MNLHHTTLNLSLKIWRNWSLFTILLRLARKSPSDPFLLSSPALPSLLDKVNVLRDHTWPEYRLDSSRFVVFDTETTGFCYNKQDEIISVGAVAIENGQITDSCFSQFVNPNRPIPEIATEITGITNEMVANSPDVLTVLDQFLEFKGLSPLIAHTASFDLNFINVKLRKYCGHRLNTSTIDTLLLAQLLFPMEDHLRSLDSLAQYYNIDPIGRHTALGDALITAQIYLEMLDSLSDLGIKTTYQLANHLLFHHLI